MSGFRKSGHIYVRMYVATYIYSYVYISGYILVNGLQIKEATIKLFITYHKRGEISWAKLSWFLRVPQKFSREYLAIVKQ